MVTLKQVDKVLISKAIEKAKTIHDEWNAMRYERMTGHKITPAERDDLNYYLFGQHSQWVTMGELKALSF